MRRCVVFGFLGVSEQKCVELRPGAKAEISRHSWRGVHWLVSAGVGRQNFLEAASFIIIFSQCRLPYKTFPHSPDSHTVWNSCFLLLSSESHSTALEFLLHISDRSSAQFHRARCHLTGTAPDLPHGLQSYISLSSSAVAPIVAYTFHCRQPLSLFINLNVKGILNFILILINLNLNSHALWPPYRQHILWVIREKHCQIRGHLGSLLVSADSPFTDLTIYENILGDKNEAGFMSHFMRNTGRGAAFLVA